MATSAAKQPPGAAVFPAAVIVILALLFLSACSSENASEFQAEGRKLMEQNNPGGAIVFFKNALDREPNNFEIRFDLGKAYLKMGKLDQAEDEFKKCLHQRENNPELHLELARLYTMARKSEKALGHIAAVENAVRPSAETRELAALNYSAQGNSDEAEKALKEALDINPAHRGASAALIRLYVARKLPGKALELSEQVLAADPEFGEALRLRAEIAIAADDLGTAKQCYARLVRIMPDEAGPYYMLGIVHLREGNVEEAKRMRDAMRARFKPSAFECMLSGMIADQEGDFRLASTMFQNAVEQTPTPEGYFRLALSLARLGNPESALSNLRRILDRIPHHAPALHLTAQILLDQGRLEDAETAATALVSHHPGNASGHYLLGSVLNAQGKTEPALESLQKALAINPAMSEAAMRRSAILMAEKRAPEAMAELSRALDVNSGNLAARKALFEYYLGKRDFRNAEQTVDEGLEALPANPLLLTLKASLHAARKNTPLALEALEQARRSDPDFLPALNLLLRLHLLAGRNVEALAACDEYLGRHPDAVDQLIISASLLDNQGRPDEARQRLEKANSLGSQRALIVLVRRELIAQRPEKAEQHLLDKLKEKPSQGIRSLLATFYLDRKQPEKALALYDGIAATNAGEAALGKYRVLMARGNYEQARLQAEEITRIDPSSSMGPMSVAGALEKLGQYDKALETLENAHNRLHHPQLLVAVGNLCLRAQRYEKAETYFRTALHKNPKELQALVGLGHSSMQQRRFSEAVASYEKALELVPENIAVGNNLAMAMAEEGKDTGRAVDMATKVFVSHPDNPRVVDTLGFCLLADKQVEAALVVLKNGIQAHPESALLHYRYGMVLLENDQEKEGMAAFEKALQLGEFPEQETVRKMLLSRTTR